MARTNQQIIDAALIEANILEEGGTADATKSATCLLALNQMMADWEQSDKDLHWFPQDTLGDTCPIPVWAEWGVTTNLALRVAKTYSVPFDNLLVQNAKEGENLIARTLMKKKLKNTDMSHLPQGSGSWGENNGRGRSILTDQ